MLEDADGMLGEIGARVARCARYEGLVERSLPAHARGCRRGRAR
jgi:hypothetical protein